MEEGKRHKPIEECDFFIDFEACSDEIWDIVQKWSYFDRDTLGKQLVRAMDSIGFNLAEGDGRFTAADGLHFLITARASAREARLGLNKAKRRGLIRAEKAEDLIEKLSSALKRLNLFVGYRRKSVEKYKVREPALILSEDL